MTIERLPWESEYRVFGIPKTFKPYPEKPVYDILETVSKKYKKNGLIQNNYKITYPELKDHVDRLATALAGFGLRKGDRVATLLPTSIQFFVADYAISRAGLVQIPSSSLEPPDNLEHKFKEGSPKALICLDEYLDVARKILAKVKIPHIIITKINDYSNSQPEKYEDIKIQGSCWMMDLIRNTDPNPPQIIYNVEEDLETLLFTGGTTGLPKGCMLTHRNIYANAIQNLHVMGQAGLLLRGAISVLLGLPFFHSYGHLIMHSMTLFGFNQILINDPRDTDGMVQMIKDYRPVLQIGVPTQFMKLCETELKGLGMLGLSGSAPLPPSAQEEFEKKSGGGIMEGYGLSEMSPTTHLNTSFLLRLLGGRIPVTISNLFMQLPGVKPVLNGALRLVGTRNVGFVLTRAFSLLTRLTAAKPKDKSKKTSVEKRGTIGVPFPDTEVRIIEVGTGKQLSWSDVASGKVGEMLLRGPQRMLGYWPEKGDGVDKEGFIHTSDVVKVDSNGYFYIVDRTKDMIIVSGYKVYSREVDDILYKHKAVDLAATVGIPDPEREGSERVVVYIQPRNEFKGSLDSSEIISYLKEKVPKYAIPKKVFIIDEIPLTEVQKVDKKKLRKLAIEQFEDGELKDATA
ncbi:MAG TPA: AMP-binding protein [Spirochaetota bacterium]|nr:AMP-binding protein [Spirochaetota bacterium]HPI90325.1 AMP-binding protein [Spirochaetota bacterium]HPR49414.1 AMP-binding protein [Spirochaetota bacterium]